MSLAVAAAITRLCGCHSPPTRSPLSKSTRKIMQAVKHSVCQCLACNTLQMDGWVQLTPATSKHTMPTVLRTDGMTVHP
jgi:hypothetical protein